MGKLLVVYSTIEGQTAKIAQRIAQVIQASSDFEAEVCDVAHAAGRSIDEFDGVLVGGSIHIGKHAPQLAQFVADHLQALKARPTAFFSVSLSAAGNATEHKDAERCLSEFLDTTHWDPGMTATFAGAIMYQKYGFIKRFFMKMIASGAGGNTDTSKNYEYTDWDQVEQFANRFLRQLADGTAKVPR